MPVTASMKITLAENFRAIFYAPFYALKAFDLAGREGLEIEWLPPRTPGVAFDEVKRGAVDLTWGGPMRVLKDHDRQPPHESSLVCFGEVVSRDPFYLVGNADAASFELSALTGLRLGIVSEVPTPWLCLLADLQDAGFDVATVADTIHIESGLTMPRQLRSLREGTLDVCQLFEPYVSEAVADGAGRVLYAACERGPTVYTTFICSRGSVSRHHDAFVALTRALRKLQEWIAVCDPEHLADIVAPFFPDVPAAVFRSSIRRYHRAGIWARHPEVSAEGFARLAYSLHAGRFITSPGNYAACVHHFDGTTIRDHVAH